MQENGVDRARDTVWGRGEEGETAVPLDPPVPPPGTCVQWTVDGCARVGRVEMSPFQTEEDGWGDRSRTKSVQAQQAATRQKIYE